MLFADNSAPDKRQTEESKDKRGETQMINLSSFLLPEIQALGSPCVCVLCEAFKPSAGLS